jgi:membrane protein
MHPVMTNIKQILTVLKQSVSAWLDDRAPSMGAALAYYTAFSIAPLLIIAIAVAGLVFGRDAAQEAVVSQFQGLVGKSGGAAIEQLLASTADFGSSVVGLVVGVAALTVAATTAFVELQDDLDRIWKAQPRVGSGVVNLIRSRLLSFGMILFIGFLLTVSLILSAALAALGDFALGQWEVLLDAVTFAVSYAVITVLFAMVYKVLPNVKIAWEDVWIGAAITALLFDVGKLLIGLYIGKASLESSFGAAGPFVVLMVWIYYSTQIFLLGAEFTFAYAHRRDAVSKSGAAVAADKLHAGRTAAPALQAAAGAYFDQAGNAATEAGDVKRWPARALTVSALGVLTGFAAARAARTLSARSR